MTLPGSWNLHPSGDYAVIACMNQASPVRAVTGAQLAPNQPRPSSPPLSDALAACCRPGNACIADCVAAIAAATARTSPFRILDAACGYGEDADTLARAGHQVIALDLCPRAVARAQSSLRLCATILQPPFPPGQFDLVVCNRMFNMWATPPQRLAAIDVIATLLTAQGWFLAGTTNTRLPFFRQFATVSTPRTIPAAYHAGVLRAELQSRGFTAHAIMASGLSPNYREWLRWRFLQKSVSAIEWLRLSLPEPLRAAAAPNQIVIAQKSR